MATAPTTSSISSVDPAPAASVRTFVGRFDTTPGAQLLMVDFTRLGKIFNRATATFVQHAEYAY
jgi:hypothetical protein